MKHLIALLLTAISLSSYMPEAKDELKYRNIVILSDMSSRIRNPRFPQKDIEEIHKIVQEFEKNDVKPGKKIGDKSAISFSVFSERTRTSIDIGEFDSLKVKQRFVNSVDSAGKKCYCGLKKALDEFEDSVRNFYATRSNPGLDLISMLIEKIENEDIIKQDNTITNGIDTTFVHYENHIYIFTDGYLEYNLSKNQNRQYYFGDQEIKRIRRYCVNNKIDISTALKSNRDLGLPSCRSNKNKHINLHILETHERDKNEQFQTYNNPRGLRDNEILEAVWQKWATESGFKSFEWKKY